MFVSDRKNGDLEVVKINSSCIRCCITRHEICPLPLYMYHAESHPLPHTYCPLLFSVYLYE